MVWKISVATRHLTTFSVGDKSVSGKMVATKEMLRNSSSSKLTKKIYWDGGIADSDGEVFATAG